MVEPQGDGVALVVAVDSQAVAVVIIPAIPVMEEAAVPIIQALTNLTPQG